MSGRRRWQHRVVRSIQNMRAHKRPTLSGAAAADCAYKGSYIWGVARITFHSAYAPSCVHGERQWRRVQKVNGAYIEYPQSR